MVKNNKRIINRIIVILTAVALIIGTWGILYHKGDAPVNPMNNEAKASKVYENDDLQVDEFNDYSNLQNADSEENNENKNNDNSEETNNETNGICQHYQGRGPRFLQAVRLLHAHILRWAKSFD